MGVWVRAFQGREREGASPVRHQSVTIVTSADCDCYDCVTEGVVRGRARARAR